jgi:hypothetical protein
MKLNLRLSVPVLCCLGFTLPAAGVDYGLSHQVCRLEVPALMPSKENIYNLSTMKQRMYGFLSELVPSAVRGKESGRFVALQGMISIVTIQYEHVTITRWNTRTNHSATTQSSSRSMTLHVRIRLLNETFPG